MLARKLLKKRGMKKIIVIIAAIVLTVPAFAQVGRYKNIKTVYPGYTLKFDTSTAELTALHFDDETGSIQETVISKKQSHSHKQVGRYEFRRSARVATYQIFDTSTGEYTTVKWSPEGYDYDSMDMKIDTLVSRTVDGIKRLLKGLEEGIDSL
jgi:hypothetical protein